MTILDYCQRLKDLFWSTLPWLGALPSADLFQAAGVLGHLPDGSGHVDQQSWISSKVVIGWKKSRQVEVGLDKEGLARWGLTRWGLTRWAWWVGAWQGAPGLVLAINLITGPSPSCSRISSLQQQASSLAFSTFNKTHVERVKVGE